MKSSTNGLVAMKIRSRAGPRLFSHASAVSFAPCTNSSSRNPARRLASSVIPSKVLPHSLETFSLSFNRNPARPMKPPVVKPSVNPPTIPAARPPPAAIPPAASATARTFAASTPTETASPIPSATALPRPNVILKPSTMAFAARMPFAFAAALIASPRARPTLNSDRTFSDTFVPVPLTPSTISSPNSLPVLVPRPRMVSLAPTCLETLSPVPSVDLSSAASNPSPAALPALIASALACANPTLTLLLAVMSIETLLLLTAHPLAPVVPGPAGASLRCSSTRCRPGVDATGRTGRGRTRRGSAHLACRQRFRRNTGRHRLFARG